MNEKELVNTKSKKSYVLRRSKYGNILLPLGPKRSNFGIEILQRTPKIILQLDIENGRSKSLNVKNITLIRYISQMYGAN